MSTRTIFTNPLLLTDGYKLSHKAAYPEGTEYVYATWVPRSNQYYKTADGAVFFGLQYLVKEYLIDRFNRDFFERDVEDLVSEWKEFLIGYLGSTEKTVGEEEIRELHSLGYLPIRIKALNEGTMSPVGHDRKMGVPQLSIVNTHPKFAYLVNYLESLLSSVLFMPTTSATSAFLYKKELYRHAKKTGWGNGLTALGFQMHDFSMRGMAGAEAALISGLGHLTSFNGSETLSAIVGARRYYGADYTKELVAGTVPATEHSVMSAAMSDGFTSDVEKENYIRLLTEVYPNSPFLSIVSDTRDYKDVVANILPSIKDIIMSRPGRLVVRPDSGDPVDIICGDPKSEDEFYRKGTYESLWDNFGGTINELGFKVLDNHVGIIYGDAITLARQKEIYRRLEEKGFAATNLVLGVGSYTYQYISRDTLGFALKTSAVMINGEWKVVYKEPKTAGQTINKNSYRGFVKVFYDKGEMVAIDGVSFEDEGGLLTTVFENGKLIKESTLSEIRGRIDAEILK